MLIVHGARKRTRKIWCPVFLVSEEGVHQGEVHCSFDFGLQRSNDFDRPFRP